MTGLGIVTDGNGYYSITADHGFSAAVAPTKTGYTFSPTNRTYINLQASLVNQDYTPVLNTYTIDGDITLDSNSAPVNDVNMVGLGVTTNASGYYTKLVDHNSSTTVTPQKPGYTFVPVSTSHTNVTTNQTQDYTAPINTYTIAGYIGLPDVLWNIPPGLPSDLP